MTTPEVLRIAVAIVDGVAMKLRYRRILLADMVLRVRLIAYLRLRFDQVIGRVQLQRVRLEIIPVPWLKWAIVAAALLLCAAIVALWPRCEIEHVDGAVARFLFPEECQ